MYISVHEWLGMYFGVMVTASTESSTAEVRAHLADVVNAAISGRITYITQRGRRVAAIVPLPVAEQAERDADLPPERG